MGIRKACHFRAKCAAPKRLIAPKGEKFGICGTILEKAANIMIATRVLKRILMDFMVVFYYDYQWVRHSLRCR
jgi:hypothetical protein